MPNKNLHLSASVCGMLGKLKNQSQYVEKSITYRWSRAIKALVFLRSNGWTTEAIIANCEAINGIWMSITGPQSAESFALDVIAMEYWCGNTYLIELIKEGK